MGCDTLSGDERWCEGREHSERKAVKERCRSGTQSGLLLPEHLLLLVGFAIPLGIERPVFSGHLLLRLPCPYATPPFLFPVFYSSHIGDEFGRNECGGLTFLHTQNLLSPDRVPPSCTSPR
jgi:hypothetical protein